MLVHVWTARSFGAGVRPWGSSSPRNDAAPPCRRGSTSPRWPRTWADRVGSGRVHVVARRHPAAARLAGRRRRVARAHRPVRRRGRAGPPDGAGASAPWSPRSGGPHLMWHRLRPVLAAYAGPPLLVPRRYPRGSPSTPPTSVGACRPVTTLSTATSPSRPSGPGVTAPDEERVLALAMRVLLGPPIGAPVAAGRERRVTGEDAVTKKVYLHVGTPKTGTSYLQHVLFHNRRRLRSHGISYPADRFDAHFLAALDLMRLPWGGHRGRGHRPLGRARRRRYAASTAPRSSATRSWPPRRAPRSAGPWRASATATAPRSTWCSRCATWSARSPRSGRRTSSTAPP